MTHHELEPLDERPNKWASCCPACKQGTLAVLRDNETFVIQEYDNCMLCGQRVRYLDIEDMRRKDVMAQ